LRVPTVEEVLRGIVVSIDGPSGSGKSTTARELAARLQLRHIDTGAMYRSVTLAAMERGMSLSDADALGELAAGLDLRMEGEGNRGPRIFLGERDVSTDIRTPEVTAAVSEVSAHAPVRRAMVRLQRRLARDGGVVLEGRDIGSVVLPGADVKVYLVASARVRAQRRVKDLEALGRTASVDEVERDLIRRDEYDSGREESPLMRPVGAYRIDTSNLTIPGQVDAIAEIAARSAAERVALYHPRPDGARPRSRRPIDRFAQGLSHWVTRIVFGLRFFNRFDGSLEEPYIFAPNHVSNTDPPFIGSTLPRDQWFVAKAALFKNPLFGALIRYFHAIPIRRGIFDREAMARFVELLQSGRSVMIFPEGGRVMTGELGPPKSGVGYLALATGVAVVPIYATGTGHLVDCMLRRRRMMVAYGAPIRVPAELLEEFQGADASRQYAEMVMAAIAALRDEVER
jgi:cytidylate kinase